MSTLLLKLIDGDTGSSSRIRGLTAPCGGQYFSVYDFMTVVCGYKDAGNSARKEFKRLTQDGSEFQNEVAASCRYLKFPGSGQRDTPCMTIRALQRLLMILGGKVASKFRQEVEGTFTRVMAGDQSLIEVINANAASDSPVQQAFRQALEQEPVEPVLDDYCVELSFKRRRMELEIAREEEELRAVKLTNDERQQRLENAKLTQIKDSATLIQSLHNMNGIDERTKMQMEDYAKNILQITCGPSSGQQAITNGEVRPPSSTAAINVSVVAKELGYSCTAKQLIQIGRAMAEKYRSIHGEDPPKHKQYVNGNFVPVNSYMERDRPVMEQVIRECMHVIKQQ